MYVCVCVHMVGGYYMLCAVACDARRRVDGARAVSRVRHRLPFLVFFDDGH